MVQPSAGVGSAQSASASGAIHPSSSAVSAPRSTSRSPIVTIAYLLFASRSAGSLTDHDEHCARLHLAADRHVELAHHAVARRADAVLHLHRLEHHEHL